MNEQLYLWGPRFHEQWSKAQSLIEANQRHLAVDGGALIKQQLIATGPIAAWFALGDGDSAETDLLDEVHPQNKNLSDLSLALQHPWATQANKIFAHGFSGGRIDHHFISLGCFWRHLTKTQTQIRLDHHWLGLSPGTWHGHLPSGTCSVVTLETTKLTMSGDWHWPLLKQAVGPCDDLLLSNRCGHDELIIESDRPIFIWSENGVANWWSHK